MKKYVFIIVFLCLCFTSVLGQVNRSTVLKNGLYCQMRDGLLKIEFITPDIVRTQYTKPDAPPERLRSLAAARSYVSKIFRE